ncbi:hypothetical protein L2E82_11083 [Cichorium intybus]|uniref:Uncharacterized protein n=1 Tax=Cichorium intybus TaxID=13427 RepID=A0ACB9GCC1_CICIN|nr:hypothetical protein L2E82_11083 [Cichorium intybus]
MGVHKEWQWVSRVLSLLMERMSESSVYSHPPPHSPISEGIRKRLLNMERLTGLNYVEWLRNWRMVLVIAGKLHLIEYLIPVPPKHVITKGLYDEHDLLFDESEEVRDLMLLTIDLEFRRDFGSLGPYELIQLVEEKFQEPIEEERARIFKRLTECKLKEGSSIDSHVLKIERYIGELYKLGHPISQEMSVKILLDSLTNRYDLFIQTYRKEDRKKTFMEMRSLLTLYESLMDRHCSTGSATSGLSPVKRCSQKRSRSSGHVLRCLKLGIHRIGYSHGKIGKCSKVKSLETQGISRNVETALSLSVDMYGIDVNLYSLRLYGLKRGRIRGGVAKMHFSGKIDPFRYSELQMAILSEIKPRVPLRMKMSLQAVPVMVSVAVIGEGM